jgi:uncharacterized protein YbaR (Trm112 family)
VSHEVASFDHSGGGAYNRSRMRKDLLDILACPMDKSPLTLQIDEENGDEVIQGALVCTKCGERYPIEDRIPNLLPPEARKGV